MGLRDKIANLDLNQARDKLLEKTSEINTDKIKETADKAKSVVKEKVDNIDKEKIAADIQERTENVMTIFSEAASAISIDSLKESLSKIQFNTLKERLPKLDSNDAKAYTIIGVCVAASSGIGALGVDSKKKDSTSLSKLQKSMIVAIGNTYMIDSKFISEVNDVIINKLNITSKIGKGFVSKLSELSALEDQKPIIDAIVAGTITFVTGELSKLAFEKIKEENINLSEVDLLQFISSLYDGIGSKHIKKVIDALDKKDPQKVLDNLVEILTSSLESKTEVKEKPKMLEE